MLFNRTTISRHPFFSVGVAIGTFFSIILIGTIGYFTIEGFSFLEALYMTVITISTVGFTEVRPLSSEGRWFTIFLIVLNLTLLTFFISYLTRYFLDGHFQKYYKSYRMKNQINQLKDHVIVCGFGRNGKAAAELILKTNKHIVVIEQHELTTTDEDSVRYFISGDATQDDVLINAGIKHASALITTLPTDADNLFIVLTARELNKNLKIISRASDDSSIRKLITAGANNVVMPDKIGGTHMAMLVTDPDIKEFVDFMAFQNTHAFISEIEINKNIRIEELNCWNTTGATILGIHSSDRSYILNPGADINLNVGDKLIILGNDVQKNHVKQLVGN